MAYTKGYKAFDKTGIDKQGNCRGYLFEEGKEYTIDGELKLCSNGFHFCKDLVLTFEYYGGDLNKYCFAEVEAIGDIQYEEPIKHKACTNKLKIVRFMPNSEIVGMLDENRNSGYGNSGDWNSGNRNSGYGNSGDSNFGNRNSGYGNSGDSNSGDWNSGNRNSGNRNSGNRNSGNRNSGDWNSGNRNSGNWNKSSYETGFFNNHLVELVNVFNKPCLKSVWDYATKPDFLYFDLGDNYKQSFIDSFKEASPEDVRLLLKLPNFDYDVFEDISGISEQMIEDKIEGIN